VNMTAKRLDDGDGVDKVRKRSFWDWIHLEMGTNCERDRSVRLKWQWNSASRL